MVVVPILISTRYQIGGNRHRRITEIQRNTQQLIQLLRMLIHALYFPSLVRYANSNHSTISVGKCNDGYSQSFWFNLNTLAIKGLAFLASYYFLYSHITLFFVMSNNAWNYTIYKINNQIHSI